MQFYTESDFRNNMEDNFKLRVICVILLAGTCELTCVYKLEFPTVKGLVFTAQENANISLPFQLISTCGIPDTFTITVSKTLSGPVLRVVMCQIAHVNGTCYPQGNVTCTCLSESGTYLLTKVAEQSDNTTWTWWTNRQPDRRDVLAFNITVPDSTHDATSATTDDSGTQHNEPFPVEITTIVASSAGLSVLVIIAVVIVRARKGGRRFEVQAPMRHEAVDGSEPHRPGPARQVTLYSEFSWDSTGEYCEVVEGEPAWPAPPPEAQAHFSFQNRIYDNCGVQQSDNYDHLTHN